MRGRDVAPGDRDEARQARLRGQQIVAPLVERPVGDPIADGEELAGLVEQEREIHPVEELAGRPLHVVEALEQLFGCARRLLERGDVVAARRDRPIRVSHRPLGQLAGRGARELGKVAEQGRRLDETPDGAGVASVGRQSFAEAGEPFDPRRERVEVALVRTRASSARPPPR